MILNEDQWLVQLLASEGIPEDIAHKYQEIFIQHEITKDIMDKLTRQDLLQLSIPMCHAIRMEEAFKKTMERIFANSTCPAVLSFESGTSCAGEFLENLEST